jgi:LSD1 subclass zinc finger protein
VDALMESLFVKRTTCRSCGGPKVTRPKTGYVYCDYCATLTDWDFKACVALKPDALPPGQSYGELFGRVQKEMTESLAAKDRNRYYESQIELYKLYIKYLPGGLSPRVGDPVYREAWLDYTAKTTTVLDFDSEHPKRTAAVTATTRAIQFENRNGKFVAIDGFWPMWEAFRARLRSSLDLNVKVGLLAQQPDGAPYELLERMGVSAIVQGWLDKLSPEDAERLMVESKMKGDYVAIAPPPMTLSKCSGCTADLHVAQGAKRVLCEACGRLNAIGVGSITCPTCGGNVAVETNAATISCPYCKTDFSRR